MILARTVLPSATLSPVVPIQDTSLSFHDFCEESFVKWGNVLLGSPSYIHINKREQGSIGTDMANVFARRSQIRYRNTKVLDAEKQKHAWGPQPQIQRRPPPARSHAGTLQAAASMSPYDPMRLAGASAIAPSWLDEGAEEATWLAVTGFESFSKHCRLDKVPGVAGAMGRSPRDEIIRYYQPGLVPMRCFGFQLCARSGNRAELRHLIYVAM
ncbi:hypothetical protein LA080_008155 [Diaporthe eres]|nr:hypothetical protein LA080_008155 [Diaporthe eres]